MSKRLTSNNKWMQQRLSQVSGPNKSPPAGHESQSESWLRPWSFVVGRDCKERQMFYGKANWERSERAFNRHPNKSSFNKPLPQTSFHWLNRGRVGIYSPVPVPRRWPPCLSAPPPNPMLSCKQQPGAFFVFHLHEWEGFLRNQGTTKLKINKTNTRKILKPFGFSELIYFSSTLQTTHFTPFSGRWTFFFFYLLTFHKSDNSLKYHKHLWRDSLHL